MVEGHLRENCMSVMLQDSDWLIAGGRWFVSMAIACRIALVDEMSLMHHYV